MREVLRGRAGEVEEEESDSDDEEEEEEGRGRGRREVRLLKVAVPRSCPLPCCRLADSDGTDLFHL